MGSEMYVDDLKKYESELCETEIVHIASDTISEFNWFMDNSRQLKKGKIKKSYLRKDLHLGAVSVVWYGESEMDFVMLDFSATEVTFVLFLNSGNTNWNLSHS